VFFIELSQQHRVICSILVRKNEFKIENNKIFNFFVKKFHNSTQKSAVLSKKNMSKMPKFQKIPNSHLVRGFKIFFKIDQNS